VDLDRQSDIAALDTTLTTVERVLDVDGLRGKIQKLEHEASDPKLWDDQSRAQRSPASSPTPRASCAASRACASARRPAGALRAGRREEGGAGAEAVAEADAELKSLQADIEAMEVRTLLSGEYDEREALVTIRSGAGGVDAADWAEMLMRMYIRWAEQHNPVEVFDTSYAEEAGIKSATFAVHAPFAYGNLSVEQGTHRLVRISPFDNQNRRQTLRRSRGAAGDRDHRPHRDSRDRRPRRRLPLQRPGRPVGQHHRLRGSTHPHPDRHRRDLPEREVAAAEQGSAMRVLQAKLPGTQAPGGTRRDGCPQGRRRQFLGQPDALLRSAPYQMVKDLRTDYEVGNPTAVLDGDIDGFLEAGIGWRNRR
jgi:peptide chain release factor 2